MPEETRRPEPFPAFRFAVQAFATSSGDSNDIAEGWFSEISGLETTMEPFQIREGGWNQGPHIRAGAVTQSAVVLKRGMTADRSLWTWFDAVINQGRFDDRRDIVIQQRGYAAEDSDPVVVAWRLTGALPVRYKASDLDATSGALAIEELQLAHEGLTNDTAAEGP